MKRWIVAMGVLGLMFAPLAAQAGQTADGTWDGDECAESTAGAHHATFVDRGDDQVDRGYVCVSDGDASNGSELYVGGEGDRDETDQNPPPCDEPDDTDGGALDGAACPLFPEGSSNSCGAIIVAGNELAGESDWASNDAYGDSTDAGSGGSDCQ